MWLDPKRYEMVDDQMAEILRRMTEQERLAVAGRMWRSARTAIRHIVASENPDWSPSEVEREVGRRMSHGAV